MKTKPQETEPGPDESGMRQAHLNEAVAAFHTYYRVGVPFEHFGHYVPVGRGYTMRAALCGTLPVKGTRWVVRGTSGPVCNACHSEACKQPSRVRPPPDQWYKRPEHG